MDSFQFLALKQIWIFSPLAQLAIITILYLATGITQYPIFKKTGRLSYNYPPNSFLIFAPIYEEIIFRGFLFATLIPLYGFFWAIAIQSIFFGLWHLRSLLFMPAKLVIWQVLYTGFILGPAFAIITLLTGTIWIAVILHFLNNFLSFATDRQACNAFTEFYFK